MGGEQQKSFDDLKQVLTNPPILQFPDNNREYFLETDASIQGIFIYLVREMKKVENMSLVMGEEGYGPVNVSGANLSLIHI